MPTAAKLCAAILFGALAWWVSSLVEPLVFPDGANPGWFTEYNALIGAFIGWRVAGGRARTTWPNAVAYGITAAVEMVAVALLLYSTLTMLSQSTRMVYEGPIEALADVARIMVMDGQKYLLQPEVLISLAVGGVLAGLATEWVARNYR
jgi:hypothetical protein